LPKDRWIPNAAAMNSHFLRPLSVWHFLSDGGYSQKMFGDGGLRKVTWSAISIECPHFQLRQDPSEFCQARTPCLRVSKTWKRWIPETLPCHYWIPPNLSTDPFFDSELESGPLRKKIPGRCFRSKQTRVKKRVATSTNCIRIGRMIKRTLDILRISVGVPSLVLGATTKRISHFLHIHAIF
jgi:hypothetical protein